MRSILMRAGYTAAVLGMLIFGPSQAQAQSIIGLTSQNSLISFSSATPGTTTAPVAITGLQTGETILGIDLRPVNGLLYGVGSTSRLYTLNPTTGAATAIDGPFTPAL